MILSEKPQINAYNMDCMEFMRDKPDNCYDLAIVDPPYGVNCDKGFEGFEGFGGFGKPIARKQYSGEWDSATPDKPFFDELIRVSSVAIIWGGNFFTDKLPQSNHWLFWNKMNTMPTFGDGELAWTNVKRNSVKMHTLEYNGLLGKEKNRIHPTQKPVALYRWLLKNYAKEGDKILDTHGGSFSSAIACHMEGFDLDICELDEDYFNDAVKRFKLNTVQEALFA